MNWYSANDIDNSPFPGAADGAILRAGLNVVLIRPEIAPNAGNISRLCYASGTNLHIVGKPGFDIKTDKHFKRAAVDYWDRIDIKRYADFGEFIEKISEETPQKPPRVILTSTNGRSLYFEFGYQQGDYIVFGPESVGIEADLLEHYAENTVRIPLQAGVRSLNLSTACGIIVFHAITSIYRSSLI